MEMWLIVYEERQAKSISNSETFENDLEGIDEIAEAFKNIADCVSKRAIPMP